MAAPVGPKKVQRILTRWVPKPLRDQVRLRRE